MAASTLPAASSRSGDAGSDGTWTWTWRPASSKSPLGVPLLAWIAVVVAVIGAYLAELSGASSGLGFLYQQAEAQLLMPRAYAAVLILCLFAIALFGLLSLAERRAIPWAYQSRGEPSR